jgi:D-ornithine 4,5-aminomutase subunit alpha
MNSIERPDDFAERRQHVQRLSDAELHSYFWELVDRIIAPLIEEARTHTSPSIERSVLLRMGFSSTEAKSLVKQMGERNLLAHGAGRLILELAKSNNLSIREAGLGLLDGQFWEQLPL